MFRSFRRSTRTAIATVVLLVSLAMTSRTALAYEKVFHREISRLALQQLASERDLLSQLGLHQSDLFPHSTGLIPFVSPLRSADDWILQGSEDEDNISSPLPNPLPFPFPLFAPVLIRARNHFFDPIYQRGSTLGGVGIGSSALKWGTEGTDLIPELPVNLFTIGDAESYLRTAVTDPDFDTREQAWGNFFYTLGHLIHLIQDMAQPQHVRDDFHLHPGDIVRGRTGDDVFSGYSRYERYTNENINKFNFTGYPTVHLPTLENYWEGDEMGLAEFVNRNFVSADANVDVDRYIHPLPVDVTLADAVDERPVLFGEDHLGNLALVDLSFPVRYGSYQYRDEYLDVEQENPRLTAKSVLDLVNSSLGNEEVWTLTSRNFDAHADILLPRAVGYSAGFLDRFLRGRIEISAPGRQYYARTDQRKADGSPGTFDFLVVGLRNATPDFEMPTQTAVPQPITSGTMTLIARYHRNGCYDKELNGEFDENFVIPKFPPCSFFEYRGEEEISVSNEKVLAEVIPSDFPLDFVFDFTDKPIPVDARDITLRILFESEVGGQQEIIVGSKDISEPNFVSMINSTDYYNLNGTLYPAQQILDSDALLSQVDPDLAVARQQVTPGPVDNIRFSINGEPVASVTSLPVHGYNRFAILTDPGNINLSVRTGQGLTESTIDGGAFQSFLDKDAGGYRVSLIKKFRGLNYFFIFFSIKSTGDIPADPFILPVIESPDPVFFPTDIPIAPLFSVASR